VFVGRVDGQGARAEKQGQERGGIHVRVEGLGGCHGIGERHAALEVTGERVAAIGERLDLGVELGPGDEDRLGVPVDRQVGPGRVLLPDREDRKPRAQDHRGGCHARLQREDLGRVTARDGQGGHVGGVVGLAQAKLQPCHVGQVRQVGHGFEPGEKARELAAPKLQARIAGRVGAQEDACHGVEEFFAQQFRDDGKAGGQRVGQADGDVVAIYVEAATGGATLAIGQAGGWRRLGVEERRAEGGLISHGTMPRPAQGRSAALSRHVRPRPGASASRAHRCPIR
jgi:hypothetical protein